MCRSSAKYYIPTYRAELHVHAIRCRTKTFGERHPKDLCHQADVTKRKNTSYSLVVLEVLGLGEYWVEAKVKYRPNDNLDTGPG